MARRSTARTGGAPETADAADDGYGHSAPRSGGRKGRVKGPSAGAGGRWWVWVGRAVLWAFIIVVVFNGIWHPLREGFAVPADEPEQQQEEGTSFPETAAAAFATRFAEHYLNAEDGGGTERAEALAAFVPEGTVDAYTVGTSLNGTEIQVVTVDAEDDHNAIVTLMADVNGAPVSLDVPVYAESTSSLVVSGTPALLAAPEKATLPDAPSAEADDQAREELQPVLTSFFEAYAENPEHLSRYLENGADVSALPADTLSFGAIDDVAVPARAAVGEDDVRQATATVEWNLPGGTADEPATLTQSYRITVVKDGAEWYVRDIQGAPQASG